MKFLQLKYRHGLLYSSKITVLTSLRNFIYTFHKMDSRFMVKMSYNTISTNVDILFDRITVIYQ